MIFEQKDIEIRPPELCVRVATQNDIPAHIRERGVAVLNDNTVWVCGAYAGRLVNISHEGTPVFRGEHYIKTIIDVTIISVGRTR